MKKLLISSALLALAACNTSPVACNCGDTVQTTARVDASVVGEFPTAVNDQITDSVTQSRPPGLEALKLLDHINENLEEILRAKGVDVKALTCEPPPAVCR